MQINNIQSNIKSNQYRAEELTKLLKSLQNQQISGTLYLDGQINAGQKQRSRVLVWKNGEIIYGGLNIPNNEEFAQRLGQKYRSGMMDAAISLAKQKAIGKTSIRELLELLIKMRVLSWEQIETVVHNQVVLTLEQLLPYPGKFNLDPTIEFDLCYGRDCHSLSWEKLMLDLNRRQQEWKTLAPLIPSGEVVPQLPENGRRKITDTAVAKHLQQWVDGQRSLVDIAEALQKDPFQLAKSYVSWAQVGWVRFPGSRSTPSQNPTQPQSQPQLQNQPTILAVDDSTIIQTTIKRALGDYYNVLLASNAVDGLNLLNNKPISLLLLDVTMPDIDGLEMCRTVRSIPKFRKLPIVMLTAKDTLVDKLKGQIAGSNHYLTKPFDPENLLELVSKYVGVGNT